MQFSLLQQALVAASRVNTLLDEGESQRVTHERRVSRGHVQLIDVKASVTTHSSPYCMTSASMYRPAASLRPGSGKSTLLSLLLRFYARRRRAGWR